MSTRSAIGAWRDWTKPNQQFEAIYCHFDGYPDSIGHHILSTIQTGGFTPEAYVDLVLSEKVGWSVLGGKDVTWPSLWLEHATSRSNEITIHVRSKHHTAALNLMNSSDFSVADPEVILRILSSHDGSMLKTIRLKVFDDTATYNLLSEEVIHAKGKPSIASDHRISFKDFKAQLESGLIRQEWAKFAYWIALAPQSYWQRGVDNEGPRYSTFKQMLDNPMIEWLYLLDDKRYKLWVYRSAKTGREPNIWDPYAVIDLSKETGVDWNKADNGRYKPAQTKIAQMLLTMKA